MVLMRLLFKRAPDAALQGISLVSGALLFLCLAFATEGWIPFIGMSTYHHNRIHTLHWCHNGHDDVSNQQPHHCLLNRLFKRRSKKISKLRVTGLCAGNSPVTGEFPAQMASNANNVSNWWRHHDQDTWYKKLYSRVIIVVWIFTDSVV